MNTTNSLGLYIHIPFCVRKCKYCDFLSFNMSDETKAQYVTALICEINSLGKKYGKAGLNRPVPTIFIGGGTPSILNSQHICKILTAIYNNFSVKENAEITIECNPGTLSPSKLSDYKNIGINRLSIGLQTANDKELAAIGRIHSFSQFLESYNYAVKLGFNNINIDLMSALPYQTLASYEDTLKKVIALKPQHISAYSLILEEGTPLFDFINNGNESLLPDEDAEREMYYLTDNVLKDAGYQRYEISNYSKAGYECKHNLSYWDRVDYLGLGLGASSLVNSTRYKNTDSLSFYMENSHNPTAIKCDITPLSKKDIMEEFMFLGLRKIKGISINAFKQQFGMDIFEVYGDVITKYKNMNLLSVENDVIALTKQGLDVSNSIFSDFLIDEDI